MPRRPKVKPVDEGTYIKILATEIIEDPENPNTHDETQITKLQLSLMQFGQTKPIMVQSHKIGGKWVCRAGSGLLRAATTPNEAIDWNGLDYLEAKVLDLGREDLIGFAIADNQLARLSEMDRQIVSGQLRELEAIEWPIDRLGFEAFEIAEIINEPIPKIEPVREQKARPAKAETGETDTPKQGRPINLTLGQRDVFIVAARRVRDIQNEDLTEGRCLEIICREWLSGI